MGTKPKKIGWLVLSMSLVLLGGGMYYYLIDFARWYSVGHPWYTNYEISSGLSTWYFMTSWLFVYVISAVMFMAWGMMIAYQQFPTPPPPCCPTCGKS